MPHNLFIRVTGALDKRRKITFYLALIRNLTIAGRVVWSDTTIALDDQCERLKWLNEATHRVVNRLSDIHDEHATESDSGLWHTLRDITLAYPSVGENLGAAVQSTLNSY